MKDLHVSVRDKVATYSERGGKVVCGNADYQIVFTFDADWSAYNEKTAVFIFGGTAREVKFTGNICKMPTVRNSTSCTVGVYVEDLATTTPAYIPCSKSILCEKESATTVIDVSSTTATEEDVRYGETFYKANGEASVGTLMVLPEVSDADEGKILGVVDGEWAVTDAPETGGGVSSWNDLTDKPFGDNEDGTVTQLHAKYLGLVEGESETDEEWLAKTTGTTQYFSTFGFYGLPVETTTEKYEAWVANTDALTVVWGTDTFVCSPQTMSGYTLLGDATQVGGVGNGEPFCITIVGADADGEMPMWVLFSTSDAAPAEHTARIYRKCAYTIKEQYLPMDKIDKRIDAYIETALGGIY